MRINVKELRQGAGLSQSQMARDLGVNRQTVIQWERGACDPRPSRYADLVRVLKLTDARDLFS